MREGGYELKMVWNGRNDGEEVKKSTFEIEHKTSFDMIRQRSLVRN
jgi:hypothetical protein